MGVGGRGGVEGGQGQQSVGAVWVHGRIEESLLKLLARGWLCSRSFCCEKNIENMFLFLYLQPVYEWC